jgi:ATP-dependent DNA ligase
MNSDEIYDLIEAIKEQPSKNEKIKMLAYGFEDENFEDVVWHTYNPFIMYGIKNITFPLDSNGYLFDNSTFNLLDDLAKRRLTGHAARDAVLEHMSTLSIKSKLLFKMILNKSLEAGFDAKSINKARDYEFIPVKKYMRFSLPKNIKMENFKFPAYSQEKMDGLFVNITKSAGDITMLSRSYQPMPIEAYSDLINELNPHMKGGFQYHGELLVEVNGEFLERKTSNGIIRRVNLGGSFKPEEHPVFVVWDRVSLPELCNGGTIPYWERLSNLHHDMLNMDDIQLGTNLKWTRIIDTRTVQNLEEAEEHFIELVKKGCEGTMLKAVNLIWKDGTTTSGVKFKKEFECELRVIEFLEGTGANKDTFGSLLCVTEDGELSVGVGNLTDALTQEIWNDRGDWLYAIIGVTYSEVICDEKGNYSLFEPKFIERRYDKDEADTLEHLLNIQEGKYDL